jgi:hypothetical protein
MKRVLALLGVALGAWALPASLAAQTGDVRFGALGGVGLAKIALDPSPDDVEINRARGGAGGLTVEFALSESLFLDARALWVRKGAQVDAIGPINAEALFKIGYVSLPVLLKLKGGGQVRPYFGAGPELAFKTSARARASLGSLSEEEDISEDVKSIDFGLALAAGVELPVGRRAVFLEAGYLHGLTNVDDNPDVDVVDAKNRAIMFLAGFRF